MAKNSSSFWGLVIAFGVLTVAFFVVERLTPGIKGQKVKRHGFRTDVVYWFFTPLVSKALSKMALILPALIVIVCFGVSKDELTSPGYHGFGILSHQPVWLQGLELFLLGDLTGYWSHRMFHTGRWWPFHAVHHSSEELDWLSSTRLHPVNDVVSKLFQSLPALLLGLDPKVLVAYIPFLTVNSIVLHANVNWTYGPFRGVIASPVFHRWHHTKEAEAMDKNFAGFFPFWDMLFGTYYMPKDRLPKEFGIEEKMPEGIVGQLAYPFGKRREAQAAITPEAAQTGNS